MLPTCFQLVWNMGFIFLGILFVSFSDKVLLSTHPKLPSNLGLWSSCPQLPEFWDWLQICATKPNVKFVLITVSSIERPMKLKLYITMFSKCLLLWLPTPTQSAQELDQEMQMLGAAEHAFSPNTPEADVSEFKAHLVHIASSCQPWPHSEPWI